MSDHRQELLNRFLEDGWIIALIGASAMVARLLSTINNGSFLVQIKKVIASALFTTVVWLLVDNVDINSLYKAILYGLSGLVAPEIIQGIIKQANRYKKKKKKLIRSVKNLTKR